MFKKLLLLLLAVSAVIFSLGTGNKVQTQKNEEPQELTLFTPPKSTISGDLPLMQALEVVAPIYGFTYSYEDPFYESTDLEAQWIKETSQTVYNIKGGTLDLGPILPDFEALGMPGAGTTDPGEVVSTLVEQHAQNTNAGRFHVMRQEREGHVIIRVIPNEQYPIMDTVVSFSLPEPNCLSAVEALSQALTKARGMEVGLGSLPFASFGSVPFGDVSDKPAREVVQDILDRVYEYDGIRRNWVLLHNPTARTWGLSFQMATRVVRNVLGPLVVMPYWD